MSRFFASGYNSDSSSEEEDLLSTSEEELLSSSEEFSTDSEFENESEESSDDDDSDYNASGPSYFLKKDFLKKGAHDSDSDSDGDGRKVVKSAKDKLLDDLREGVDALYNAKNLENWSNVLTEFDRLSRLVIRVGQQKLRVPNFYYKMLGQLDAAIAEITAEKDKRKLPADQNRAFNTTRQRMKKMSPDFQAYLEYYRDKPEAFDAEEPVEIGIFGANDADDSSAVVGAVSGTTRLVSPLFTTLRQIADSRGKKNIDKMEQVEILEKLLDEARESGRVFDIICVYQMLLSVRFDAGNSATMPVSLWKDNQRDFESFLTFLEQNSKSYWVSEKGVSLDDWDVEPPANEDGVRVIMGSVAAVMERLDDEFAKGLQTTDPHSTDYIERLKDETALYRLLVRTQIYVQSTTGASEHLARVIVRRMDHLYYKPDQLISACETAAWENAWPGIGIEDSSLMTKDKAPADVLAALSSFLSKQENAIYGQHALLCSTYYYSVNSRYSDARELFLSSQMYNHIATADSNIQVLYNRALVQLGLSAFRAGEIDESHQILNEIANSQRLKELLGQGFNSKYPNQATTAEKQKLLPFHMHINLELLECVFMTASLLIEIPALAAQSSTKDSRRKASIKSFKSKLEFHDRQYFTGPPESIKDHLIYASRYLQKGNWAKSYDLLSSIKIWRLFPDHAQLLLMLKRQLQVEGLRTYIFTYKAIFSKLSLAKLASMFQLDDENVAALVDKMLSSGEVQGSVENGFVNFVTDAPQRSKLQELAIVMNEKVGLLNEKNEKTASNGHGRNKNAQQQQQQQQQKEQKEQKEYQQEENSKFRYANVNTNNDEFQVTA
ncbi:putative eukaryotic translation initiation factor [Clavispora lusitaniae]|uniref:Eukaryotic translation initiation factor n=1 Tax=Clavispora lusitaniae TaxID=36911 RepID=A0ACD0WNT5_CLALS|nr:putative eukaryotic translation initiation factor [Clavispora lusitaniae]QFZ34842.1 putative eukaryotic translation initiation factor [Clavispora lusitaniae]QFZ40527.1 putative eukaryotic translation initiation factor [Clavispora lusitaniae]QFZ46207.1 putative eukaryotic translation initiation factor [Clavispora lusitaniae]QFZ51869.1 putative eukaryotic translation initiation factor [Clavispora lusitaniae]